MDRSALSNFFLGWEGRFPGCNTESRRCFLTFLTLRRLFPHSHTMTSWQSSSAQNISWNVASIFYHRSHALVSFKKYMPPPLPYFKVNIYPFPLSHFASIFIAYLWSFRWPNYIVTLPRYFSFRLPHLNISTGPPSDKLDKNSQRMWFIKNFSQWNGYNHFRFALDFSYAFGIL